MNNNLKPKFICIGAQKAGTTWLHRNLNQHPQVWLHPAKEIHYFDELFLKEKFIQKDRLILLKNLLDNQVESSNVNYEKLKLFSEFALSHPKDDEWYLSLFQNMDKDCIAGDITPSYSALPEVGVQHMQQLLGNEVKILYIMRNPIKRVWSQLVMNKRQEIQNNQEVTTEEWLRLINSQSTKNRSDYKKTIEIYEKYFSSEQILYLFYDDICLNPMTFLKTVCHYLDIDYKEQYFNANVEKVYNSNPKTQIPNEIGEILKKKYKDQELWIRQKFNLENFSL